MALLLDVVLTCELALGNLYLHCALFEALDDIFVEMRNPAGKGILVPPDRSEVLVLAPGIVVVQMVLLVDENLNPNRCLLWPVEQLIFHI